MYHKAALRVLSCFPEPSLSHALTRTHLFRPVLVDPVKITDSPGVRFDAVAKRGRTPALIPQSLHHYFFIHAASFFLSHPDQVRVGNTNMALRAVGVGEILLS